MKVKLLFILSFALTVSVYAGSATWNLNPGSNDWNTAINWTPATVPNGATDVARFDLSTTTAVSLSAATTVDSITFNPGASAFTITTSPGQTLSFSGAGVTNNSGITQSFTTALNTEDISELQFLNEASAGNSTLFTVATGHVDAQFNRPDAHAFDYCHLTFFDHSSAGNSTIVVEGAKQPFDGAFLVFHHSSTAGNANIINKTGGALTLFYDSSTAGRATFALEGADAFITVGSYVAFFDFASADHGSFTINGSLIPRAPAPSLFFYSAATAGHATITVNGAAADQGFGGKLEFFQSSSAGEATLVANGTDFQDATGGQINFQPGGSSVGNATIILNGGTVAGATCRIVPTTRGTATIKLFDNASMTVVNSTEIGSVEGHGTITIGTNSFRENRLVVGNNDRNTLFSGVIQGLGPDHGALQKVGNGTLTLTGANTYMAGTTISRGVLAISNQTGSGTGTGTVQVDAGTLAGGGIISGPVTVGIGNGKGAFLAPSFGSNIQVTLTLQSNLILQADGTYTYTFRAGNSRVSTDRVIAGGVTINGAAIAVSGNIQRPLSVGTVLTVISNTSANPINGTFSDLADGAIVNVNGNNFQANYSGGDGNDLTLTVVP